jgi:hypothetical protein
MKRINSANNVGALPAPLADVNAPGFFANNPGAGPGTVLSGDWANAVQEEIMAVIAAAGLAPSGGDLAQLLKGMQIVRAWQLSNLSYNFVVPAGIVRLTSVLWGGGGSGAPGGGTPGNGNGGGGFSLKRCTVAPGDTIPVTVGQGGAPGGAALPGGSSSFGAFHSATGGSATLTSGIGVGGDVNFGGSQASAAIGSVPGSGGSSPFGGSGGGPGQGGQVPGGGGGGADVGFGAAGGAHGASLVIW